MDKELQSKIEKAQNFSTKLSGAYLNRNEAWIAYKQYYSPSEKYGLVIRTPTKQESTQITQQYQKQLLNALGFNQHFPKCMIEASPEYGSLGISSPWLKQGISQIMHMMGHI